VDANGDRDAREDASGDAKEGAGGARKAALLWGVIAALTLLVLVQGYQLFEFGTISIAVAGVGAVVVFVAATLLTYLLGP